MPVILATQELEISQPAAGKEFKRPYLKNT
jgi:hypothetical protein